MFEDVRSIECTVNIAGKPRTVVISRNPETEESALTIMPMTWVEALELGNLVGLGVEHIAQELHEAPTTDPPKKKRATRKKKEEEPPESKTEPLGSVKVKKGKAKKAEPFDAAKEFQDEDPVVEDDGGNGHAKVPASVSSATQLKEVVTHYLDENPGMSPDDIATQVMGVKDEVPLLLRASNLRARVLRIAEALS